MALHPARLLRVAQPFRAASLRSALPQAASRRAASLAVIAAVFTVCAEPVHACTICFAGIDSPLLDSARLGVLTMAAIAAGVLGAFGAWFLRLARLERETQSALVTGQSDPPSASSHPRSL